MKEFTIAVPTEGRGGLCAKRSEHFGRADSFTLVRACGGDVLWSSVVENTAHAEAGCVGTVELLESYEVSCLIVFGIGARPLHRLTEVGLRVYHDGLSTTVGEAIQTLLAGTLLEFDADRACQGH